MKNFKMIIISLISIFSIGVLAVFMVQGVQNKAISLEEQILSARSDIEVQEKRRIDLIGNLVDTVKAYDKYEYETLKAVVDGRNSKDTTITDITTMITATAEAHPQLKSSENYKQLMTELSVTENMIAEYRGNYNSQIKSYNRYVRKFPNAKILKFLGYETMEYKYLEYDAPTDAPKNLFEE